MNSTDGGNRIGRQAFSGYGIILQSDAETLLSPFIGHRVDGWLGKFRGGCGAGH